jgi:hypothetical protein
MILLALISIVPAKVALPVSNAIDNGVILDVDKVKLVPDAVNDGSKPPPAKLSNINFGVDLLIVKSPAKVALLFVASIKA